MRDTQRARVTTADSSELGCDCASREQIKHSSETAQAGGANRATGSNCALSARGASQTHTFTRLERERVGPVHHADGSQEHRSRSAGTRRDGLSDKDCDRGRGGPCYAHGRASPSRRHRDCKREPQARPKCVEPKLTGLEGETGRSVKVAGDFVW